MGLFRKQKSEEMWERGAAGVTHDSGLTRLRRALNDAAFEATRPLRAILGQPGQSISDRLLTLADMVSDWTTTAIGRVVTATIAVTLAYWLLS